MSLWHSFSFERHLIKITAIQNCRQAGHSVQTPNRILIIKVMSAKVLKW